jgi:dUTP pyrophosphatase
VDVVTKLAYVTYPANAGAWVQSEVQAFRNAVLRSDDWYIYEQERAFVAGPDADFEEDNRVRDVNLQAMTTADAVVVFLPPGFGHLPWEVGFSFSARLPILVVTPDHETYKFRHPGVLFLASAEGLYSPLASIPERDRSRVQRPQAKWRRIDHDTKNEDIHVEPKQAHYDDAGFDLTYDGHQPLYIYPDDHVDIPCGVAMEFPPHTWGLLVGRSSSFRNRGLLVNPAIIDCGYRGHLFAIARNMTQETIRIEPGERVAQIVPLPALAPGMELVYAQELSDSSRGEKGFGSSGL